MAGKPTFVVATPARTVCDDNARALYRNGLLRFLALGTRNGTKGVPPEHTRLNPKIGLVSYAFTRTLPTFYGESMRFRLHPWFDHWVEKQLEPGNHVISSFGYANNSFRWARAHGGRTFLDGGNSHPEDFWAILTEEHRRWKCPFPPVARHHYEHSLAMMEHVDFVLAPSKFVTRSFLDHGFKPGQILKNVYPIDVSFFTPPTAPRPKNRPLTLIAPGTLSLRKGTPYLLAAYRLVLKKLPQTELLLNRLIFSNVKEVLRQNSGLPIKWLPPMSPPQLAETLHGADLLLLPSIEDGFARTVTEGLSSGLPVITTPNNGSSDMIVTGVNGEIVPIRDPEALAGAILKWADLIFSNVERPPVSFDAGLVSFETFEKEFISQLRSRGLAP